MREKKDVLIKYHQTKQLTSMSFEEIGILFILLLKEQDTQGIRFESTTERMTKRIVQMEMDAEQKLSELSADRAALFDIAFNTLNGQAEYSKRAFDRLQKSYEGKDKETELDAPQKVDVQALIEKVKTIDRTYTIETAEGDAFSYIARAKKENKNNLPSDFDLPIYVLENKLFNEDVDYFFSIGNEDEWNKPYMEYMALIKNESEEKQNG